MTKSKQTLAYIQYVVCPITIFSIIVGGLVGVIVTCYNYMSGWLVSRSQAIYAFARVNMWAIPLIFIGLIAIALTVAALLRITPESKGGCVPRTEGALRGLLTFRWLRIFLTTLLTSALTYFSGMSLGSEGPSIQLGAALASGSNALLNKRNLMARPLMTGGASAGLAVAFNAPLTGIIFSMEEVHKKVSPAMIFTTACCVLTATFTSRALSSLWGGGGLSFNMGDFTEIPLRNFWMLIVLGIAIGVCASLFIVLLTKLSKVSEKHLKIPPWFKLCFAFLLTGIIGLALQDSIGSGHELILNIGAEKFTLGMLAVLFALKLILISVSFNSNATGGLFLPMLTIGAIIGGFFGEFFILLGLDPILYKTIVVIAMTAFFGACVRAPFTAIILIVEVTGQLSGFLMTGFAIFSAFFIPLILRLPPLYDGLLTNITDRELPKEPPPFR